MTRADELLAIAERCDRAVVLAMRHHFRLEQTAADKALREAADYAAVSSHCRALAAIETGAAA